MDENNFSSGQGNYEFHAPENDYNGGYNGGAPSGQEPGHGQAVASLVLGIIGVVCWFFGGTAILSVILGLIGIICASSAKKAGNSSGIRTAGFVLSIISLIVGALVFVACVACVGLFSAGVAEAGAQGYLDDLGNIAASVSQLML